MLVFLGPRSAMAKFGEQHYFDEGRTPFCSAKVTLHPTWLGINNKSGSHRGPVPEPDGFG